MGARAVKKLRHDCGVNQTCLRAYCDEVVAEVATLERCARCPSIITLLDVAKCGNRICLVFEFWGKSLQDIHDEVPAFFDGRTLRIVFQQCLKALAFVHSLDVIHMDVKPSNALL